MSTSVLVAKERQPGSPFGLEHKQAKKQKIRRKCATVARYSMLCRFLCNAMQRASQKTKKYGASAPQLHAIRCSIDFCVMQCNEPAFNPVQTWLSGFAALCRSTTTVGTASKNTRLPLPARLAITSLVWHCIMSGKRGGQLPCSIACFCVFHQYGVWLPQ